jgi:hypothetical protein
MHLATAAPLSQLKNSGRCALCDAHEFAIPDQSNIVATEAASVTGVETKNF